MRYFVIAVLLSGLAFSQAANQPGVQYSAFTILLVSHEKGGPGVMVAIDKQGQIVFVPIPEIAKAVNEQGITPVRYGELLQLLHQLGEDNQRLKAENDHLWKVAEGHAPSAPTTVVVQQAQPPMTDPDAERREARQMLLRSLLVQRSTVNINVSDCTRLPALCAGR